MKRRDKSQRPTPRALCSSAVYVCTAACCSRVGFPSGIVVVCGRTPGSWRLTNSNCVCVRARVPQSSMKATKESGNVPRDFAILPNDMCPKKHSPGLLETSPTTTTTEPHQCVQPKVPDWHTY
jgi:hypothetical protein